MAIGHLERHFKFQTHAVIQAGQKSFFGQVEKWYLIEEKIAYIPGGAQH
ncbi:MAG: hypothetical protein O6826_05630 [Acidobacteria bacterium]|nr:hypothetical protein [Acidobacteriota bacterium]